jgi:hypothetical protein
MMHSCPLHGVTLKHVEYVSVQKGVRKHLEQMNTPHVWRSALFTCCAQVSRATVNVVPVTWCTAYINVICFVCVCAQVTFFCAGKDTKTLMSNCKGMWNQHQLKDEIKDHTTPGEQDEQQHTDCRTH